MIVCGWERSGVESRWACRRLGSFSCQEMGDYLIDDASRVPNLERDVVCLKQDLEELS